MKPHGRYFRLVLFVYQDFEKKKIEICPFFLELWLLPPPAMKVKDYPQRRIPSAEGVGGGGGGGHSITRNEVSGKARHRDEVSLGFVPCWLSLSLTGVSLAGTNDKAGSSHYIMRWVSPQSIKEAMLPVDDYKYPHQSWELLRDRKQWHDQWRLYMARTL